MKKLLVIILLIFFILNNNVVIISVIDSLNFFIKNIFPILFPTFILCDLIISSNLISFFNMLPFHHLFKTNKYFNYIFFISLLTGTPTNSKNLKILFDNKIITKEELNKILNICLFYNPLFILKMTNYKILIIIYLSNIITGIIYRKKSSSLNKAFKINNIKFSLNDSINNNIDILLSILGTIIVFNILFSIIPFKSIILKLLYASILEFSNGLRIINLFNIYKNFFYIICLEFGSLSLLFQIKSILKDAFDLKYYLKSRLTSLIVGLILMIFLL